eukprot:761961-Hanusia_phi.AAC.8
MAANLGRRPEAVGPAGNQAQSPPLFSARSPRSPVPAPATCSLLLRTADTIAGQEPASLSASWTGISGGGLSGGGEGGGEGVP